MHQILNLQEFSTLAYAWIGVALITFFVLLKITAPFGRHTKTGWGFLIDNHVAWILMELVSPLVMSFFFFYGGVEKQFIHYFFWSLWMLHYINRSLVFPFRIKSNGKKMPVVIMVSAILFNSMNGFLNGYYLGNFSDAYSASTFMQPNFIIGCLMFFAGAFINLKADNMLIHLRKPGETGYKIPQGFLFEKVSCPNHLGEMIEWAGFAIMLWNVAGLSFAIWTIANLLPRAMAHHKWYKEHFKNYPINRKAVIPFVL